jgi:glycosyltransferase involved in cell wall biosynthesis
MLSVVIPAYKEEENVRRTYDRLSAVLDGIGDQWEIIFSVDPSPDRTEEVIAELSDEDPRVKMLRFSRRHGRTLARGV